MRKFVVALMGAASILAGAMLPTQVSAKAYTCWNPAICKAVCGKPTCGSALKSTSSSSRQSSASASSSYTR